MKEVIKLIGEVTAEQIEKWKAKFGKVHGIIVDGHIAYVRKPDRATVSYALSHMSFKMSTEKGEGMGNSMEVNMGNMLKQGEAVMNNCWLGGSDEIKAETSLWTAACMKAGELIETKEAELKNF